MKLAFMVQFFSTRCLRQHTLNESPRSPLHDISVFLNLKLSCVALSRRIRQCHRHESPEHGCRKKEKWHCPYNAISDVMLVPKDVLTRSSSRARLSLA